MTSTETTIVVAPAKLPVRNAPPTKIIPAMAKLHKSKRIRGLVIMFWAVFLGNFLTNQLAHLSTFTVPNDY